MSRLKTLPNHRPGVREIMLDNSGKVLPVISATRTSYSPERVTTYQRPEVDGIVVRMQVINGITQLTFNRYVPHYDTIVPIDTDEDGKLQAIFKNLDSELVGWLSDVKDNKLSNLLPAGFGWDGIMTATEYLKHARIRDLFVSQNDWSEKEEQWFKDIILEAVRTSTIFLKLNWADSFKLVNKTIPIQRFLPEETKVYVVTFDKVGHRTLHLVRRTINVGNSKPKPEVFVVPEGTVKAILLRTRPMVDVDLTYGVSIDLYH